MKLKRIDITKICLFSTLLVVSSGSLWAQTSVKKVDTKNADSEIETKFSGVLNSYLNSGFEKFNSVDSQVSTDLELVLRLKVNEITYGLDSSASKDLSGERTFGINNSAFSAGASLYKPNDDFSISGKLSITIPLSEKSTDYQYLTTALGLSTTFMLKASDSVTLTYLPKGTLNFHEYKTALDTTSNYHYTLAHTLNMDYAISDSFTLSLLGKYTRLTTYSGNSKDNYKFEQSIAYDFEPYTIALGHTLGGSPLAANGVETEIKLYDANDSTIYAQFGISF